MMRKYTFREEKPIHGTDIAVSVRANWKRLPPVLHKCKQLDLTITKAKYWSNWTTLYMKKLGPAKHLNATAIMDAVETEDAVVAPTVLCRLPYHTSVSIYNISTLPYTVLDFSCFDRVGLFCEIIEVLGRYDVDVRGAYINTIGGVVSNIFFITHSGKALDDAHIEYLRNNLEYEIRDVQDSY